jgi:hypothetical protein
MVKCNTINCNKTAIYGYFIDKIKLACKKHRILVAPNKMIDLRYKCCSCGTKPCFGLFDDKTPTCCSKCKSDDMIDIVHNKCKCGIRASFGFESDKKASCCLKCKSNLMIDITHNKYKCLCGIRATFGLESDTKPTCCKKCKTDLMVNIIDKKCLCGTHQPVFGLPNDKVPSCCSECKTENMIDIVNNKCICGIRPSFGLITDKMPTCCLKCKTNDMINIVDHKCSCGTIPVFGLSNDKTPTCCSKCKTDNMINIKTKLCKCGTQPIFGLLNEKPICCYQCKTEDMIDLLNTTCKAVDKDGKKFCNTRANPKYDGYCTHCFAHLFPLDPRTPNIRKNSKEIAVRNFINNNFDGFEHDHPLWVNGCDCTHKRRIDHRKVINETLLATETDEFQHKPYDKQDEIIRYDDLIMVHGGKSIFIRFNPDSYRDNGILMNPPMEERLEVLKKEIEKQIKRIENNENTEFIEIIYMYYDK